MTRSNLSEFEGLLWSRIAKKTCM